MAEHLCEEWGIVQGPVHVTSVNGRLKVIDGSEDDSIVKSML